MKLSINLNFGGNSLASHRLGTAGASLRCVRPSIRVLWKRFQMSRIQNDHSDLLLRDTYKSTCIIHRRRLCFWAAIIYHLADGVLLYRIFRMTIKWSWCKSPATRATIACALLANRPSTTGSTFQTFQADSPASHAPGIPEIGRGSNSTGSKPT